MRKIPVQSIEVNLTVQAKNAKNSTTWHVPLTDRAAEIFKAQSPVKDGYVFHKPDESQLYQTWLNQQHAAVRESLNLPKDFVFHSLRHTFGTRLGEAGADAFTIMRLMGHSTITVSQRYSSSLLGINGECCKPPGGS